MVVSDVTCVVKHTVHRQFYILYLLYYHISQEIMTKIPQIISKATKPTQDFIRRLKRRSFPNASGTKFIMVAEDTLEDATRNAYKYVPSTSVAKFSDLYGGAHIQLGMHGVYSRHAIVKSIDFNAREFTVIGYKRNERRHTAGVIEENMTYRMHRTVLLIDYENISANHLIPQFKRLPRQASISIAQYLMDHPTALQSYTGFRNNSEHFSVSCTLGYDLSFEQVKQIMIAFWALKMIDEEAMKDLANYMISRRVVNYSEGASNVKLSLQSGEEANIFF